MKPHELSIGKPQTRRKVTPKIVPFVAVLVFFTILSISYPSIRYYVLYNDNDNNNDNDDVPVILQHPSTLESEPHAPPESTEGARGDIDNQRGDDSVKTHAREANAPPEVARGDNDNRRDDDPIKIIAREFHAPPEGPDGYVVTGHYDDPITIQAREVNAPPVEEGARADVDNVRDDDPITIQARGSHARPVAEKVVGGGDDRDVGRSNAAVKAASRRRPGRWSRRRSGRRRRREPPTAPRIVEKKGENDVGEDVKVLALEVSDSNEKCDLFSGEWVPNPGGPYYTNETCNWAIQEHQNCMKFGRPDTGFFKWKWKPDGCELALFDPTRFLELVRGKSLAFVGDSVARNHMQSLLCLLTRVAIPFDTSYTRDENFKRWEYRDYDFNISIFWSPYLVRTEQTVLGDVTKPFKLFLDEHDESWRSKISNFDYIIISAGHWFFRPTYFYLNNTLVGCQYCPQPDVPHLPSYFSYRWAFRTSFRAINDLSNFNGVIFLRTFAPSHFEGGPWDKGGDCVRTGPFRRNERVLDDYNLEYYRIQLQELKAAQSEGRKKIRLFDATLPMLLRPDGHPGKFGRWPNPNVTVPSDCVHWCLPGPVDSWNDFLLELLSRELAVD